MLIWYNPDRDFYEMGQNEEYHRLKSQSINQDRFELLYEFGDEANMIVARKILSELNKIRNAHPKDPLESPVF